MKSIDSDSIDKLDNKKLFKYLYEKNPLGIAIFDSKGNFIQANLSFIELWNLSSPPEIKKLNLFDHIKISSSNLQDLKGGKSIDFIGEISLREFGKLSGLDINQYGNKFLEININPIIENGKIRQFITYFGDITNQRTTEERLKENEIRFNTIIENSHEGVFIVDDDYRFIYVNKKLGEILGYPVKEIIGKDFRKFLTKSSEQKVVERYIRRQRGEEVEKIYEFDIRRSDGSTRRVRINSTITKNLKGGVKIVAQVVDITNHKKTERELKESEEKFEILGKQDLMTIVILQDDVIKYQNEHLGAGLGYSKAEMKDWTYKDFLKHIHPKDREFVITQASKKQKGDKDVINRYQFRIVTKEGDIAWREVFSKTFTYQGRPANLISLIDITERKKAEEQLKESEEKFRTIAEQHFMGILILQDYQIKYFNNRFLHITGYLRSEIESWEAEEFFKIIHPQDRVELKEKIYQKYMGEIEMIKNFEFRLVQKSGEIIWVEVFSKTIPYEGGEADLTSIIDITERKKAEQQLKESEEKFRNIFEAIPDLFFLVDSETRVIDYKGKREKLYLKPEEFLGKKMNELLPGDLGEKAKNAVERALETKEQEIIDYSLPINEIESFYEARLLYYGNNQVAIFIRDISQRKKAEQMIKEEVKRLKEIDDMRRDLISRVSHELKTPIMAISGATEYLLETYGDKLGDEPIDFLKMIDSNESRLEKLIENLLDISRINYQKIHLAKQKCNICTLIKEVCAEMEYLRRDRDLKINLDIPKNIELEVDKIRIEQVIMNLLSNAIKNTPPGGLIRLSVKKSKHYIQILVIDNGIGFTDEEIDKLFTQFGKIERYGKGLEYLDISGSGLGLYISKKIVEMHSGEITVESRGRDKGSTFKVYLPRD
jgi:hypothetical protein